MEQKKENIQGLVGTVIFHGIIIAVLLLFSFSAAPYEYPEPEGIVIDFGQLVDGTESSRVSERPERETPQVSQTASQAVSVEEQVVTQTHTPAITIPDRTSTTVRTPDITPEEKERIERERREQEERERIDALFGGRLSGDPGNSETGARTGTPGDPNAVARGDRRGTPGNPFGNNDATSWVKPTNTQNCNNPIHITVQIDNLGNVVQITKIETALSEQACIEAARKAAMRVKFPSETSVSSPRFAVITYDYTISRN